MPLITVLSKELRNKIAAGEVIERPASVVKELIENSIDAASTEIAVEVLRGGKGLIKVADNGSGMDRSDALLCIERHATSKLRTEEDLHALKTMGFRGEALPSIASVSRMKITTGRHTAPVGVSLEIAGGDIKDTRDAPSRGTSVEVRDLFFNTPARKKFLKSDSTELLHSIDSVTRAALSHWEIGFRLSSDGRETLQLSPAQSPRERIGQVYGLEFIDCLLEIDSRRHGLEMKAFVTKGDHFRNSKAHQFIWVNRRPVKDPVISHAVYRAFEGIVPSGKHPVFFLFLTVDPWKIDFNVHPTKREVRFENKDEMFRFVMNSVREAVKGERKDYMAPFMEPEDRGAEYPSSPETSHSPHLPALTEAGVSENRDLAYHPSLPFIYLGDTFLAFSGKGGLTLLDHHAAHERILYERFLKAVNIGSHRLLFPKQIRLSPKEYRVILEHRDLLTTFGLDVDDFGPDTIIIRAVPDVLNGADLRGIISDVCAALLEGTTPHSAHREALAAKLACHSSIRGRQVLHQDEFQKLLSDLQATDHPDQCPHGRPTRIALSLDDLKKLFLRK